MGNLVPSAENLVLPKVISLNPKTGQNIAFHALPTATN